MEASRGTDNSAMDEAFPDGEPVELEANLSRLKLTLRYARREAGLEAQHRMPLIQGLSVGVEEEAEDDLGAVLPEVLELAEELCYEEDPDVQTACAGQVGLLAQVLHRRLGGGSGDMVRHLLELTCNLIKDSDMEEVVEAAEKAVREMVPALSPALRSSLLCEDGMVPLLACHPDEMLRMAAARLVGALAPHITQDELERVLSGMFSALLHDEDFDVRKDAVATIPQIAAVVSEGPRADMLVGCFLESGKDAIWNVRMECAAGMPELCKSALPDMVEGVHAQLTETFEQLLEDRSRWVSHEAMMHLGKFLAASTGAAVTPVMLQQFQRMLSNGEHGEMELQEAVRAARDVPLVATRLGGDWWAAFGDALKKLAACPKAPIRAALASSLHLLASIETDHPTCKEELSEIFLAFLKDESRTVQSHTVQHLGSLLSHFPRHCWDPALRYLPSLTVQDGQNCSNWRTRCFLSQQLSTVAASGDVTCVAEHLLPCALQLCRDPVAAVRKDAAQEVGDMLAALCKDENEIKANPDVIRPFTGQLCSLSKEANHISRQTFADICGVVLSSEGTLEELSTEVMTPLLQLVDDPLPLVRIRLAKALYRIAEADSQPSDKLALVRNALQKLLGDDDQDVQEAASGVRCQPGEVASS